MHTTHRGIRRSEPEQIPLCPEEATDTYRTDHTDHIYRGSICPETSRSSTTRITYARFADHLPGTPQDTADTSQWSSSLFSEFFDFELDPCPDGVGDFYGGEPEGGIVTLDELTSAACGDDWLEYEGSCYFKSSFVESSTSWEDADAR